MQRNEDLDQNSAVRAARSQALEQARRLPGFRGICKECGCTENNACLIPITLHGTGLPGERACGWANREQTVCDNPECMAKAGLEAMKTVAQGEAPAPGPTAPMAEAFIAFLETPEAVDICGRICFMLGGIANILKNDGAAIESRAEAEQSYVIRWMLKRAVIYGADWKDVAEKELQDAIVRWRAKKAFEQLQSGEQPSA